MALLSEVKPERVAALAELERRIGYQFHDLRYLERAMTHSSFSNETGARDHHLLCNERLEFLGDSVLSIITSDYLFSHFGILPEGDLTRMRAAVVCEEALAGYSERIGLGEFLRLGKGEEQTGGAKKPAVIADAFEATLAAIYLDAGGEDGLRRVSEFLLPFISRAVEELPIGGGVHSDCKSRLQEFVQKEGDAPIYRLEEESGPDHNKTFTVSVFLGTNRIGTGVGHSKKSAEQAAAKDALQLFGIEP